MKKRTIAALSLLSTTVVASLGDSGRPEIVGEPVVHTHDPCVLTRTPEPVCRRFKLVDYGAGRSERIRVILTTEQRAAAEAWWQRPENRWRRLR